MGLRTTSKKLLNRCGLRCAGVSSRQQILEVIRLMTPKSVGHELVRIGGKGDGGYLVPDDLEGIAACFSPGVSTTADFECMLASKYNIKSFLADYSVDAPPLPEMEFDFEKKYLGMTNDDIYMRLEDWVDEKIGTASKDDLMLQMDIEGGEYDVIIDTPASVLRKFRIMVIEFHVLDLLFDAKALRLITAIFKKLSNDFSVAHIHPNNCSACGVYNYRDIIVPSVMEMTFIRNGRVRPDDKIPVFPHPLDMKNDPANDDVVLPAIWQQ